MPLYISILTIEFTFLDLTLEEKSLLRNKQASTPAVVRKTVATTMGTRAKTRLFCTGCWVVTVGGVSAVSVTFLVSPGRLVVAFTVLDPDSAVVEPVTMVASVTAVAATVLLAAVGDVEASATGVSAATVFCVATTVGGVGFAVGTLFVGLGGIVLAGPGGGSLLGGVKLTP